MEYLFFPSSVPGSKRRVVSFFTFQFLAHHYRSWRVFEGEPTINSNYRRKMCSDNWRACQWRPTAPSRHASVINARPVNRLLLLLLSRIRELTAPGLINGRPLSPDGSVPTLLFGNHLSFFGDSIVDRISAHHAQDFDYAGVSHIFRSCIFLIPCSLTHNPILNTSCIIEYISTVKQLLSLINYCHSLLHYTHYTVV